LTSASGSNGERLSRRRMLRLMAVSAIGAGAVIGAGALLLPPPDKKVSGSAVKFPATVTVPIAPSVAASAFMPSSSPTAVKVTYFQMPTVVSEPVEHYVLQAPAHYSDLLGVVLVKHPSLAAMMPNMMVLVNGTVPQPSTVLANGDEVDFVPAIAGG
jgi:molybdopterin converting factor small subunit